MNLKNKSHDSLQAEIFMYVWNTYPELRYLMFSVRNNLTTQLGDKEARRTMGILKALGMVKGVLDLLFYYGGSLHAFDIKVGTDKLRSEQLEFICAIENQGGHGYEVRSLEEFKEIFKGILDGKY